MIISSDPEHPAYDPLRFRNVKVYLNGESLKNVTTASEEGWLEQVDLELTRKMGSREVIQVKRYGHVQLWIP